MFLNKGYILKGVIFLLLFGIFVREVYSQNVSDIRTLLSPEGNVLYGNEQNSIFVLDYPENIKKVEDYLAMVDAPPMQVLIEARVVEVKLQGEHALGVNWSAFFTDTEEGTPLKFGQFKISGETTTSLAQSIDYKGTVFPDTSDIETPFSLTLFSENINVVLQTLANSLDTNVLSAPKITTVNNREAEIRIVKRQPWAEPEVETSGESGNTTVTWQVNFEEIGITLRVTPTITDDGQISMELNPEVSENTGDFILTLQVEGYEDPIDYAVPIIDTRSANTKVIIGNGQTLIIGGLIKNKTTAGVTKVPVIGDIPILGWLFKSKKDTVDKTELLIFVSPTIITPGEFVRMEKKEKFGVGKWYTEDLKKKEEDIRKEEEKGKEKFISRLNKLEESTRKLSTDRKTLEKMISNDK